MERHAIFPLSLFLLPGENTYLHIFEPRYKQLLKDVEEGGIPFGIYYQSKQNRLNLGTMVELVEVIKRYPGGELDIRIQANRIFKLEWFFEKMDDKLYPGGEIKWKNVDNQPVSDQVFMEYKELLAKRNIGEIIEIPKTTLEIASNLNLKSNEKMELIRMKSQSNRNKFLLGFIRLFTAIAEKENDSEYNFHLN